jgi:hypothetical protein
VKRAALLLVTMTACGSGDSYLRKQAMARLDCPAEQIAVKDLHPPAYPFIRSYALCGCDKQMQFTYYKSEQSPGQVTSGQDKCAP